jgi:hypothetical protein
MKLKLLIPPFLLASMLCVGCVVDSGPGPYDYGDNGGGSGGPNPSNDQCNPVTGAGCPSGGYTCDLDPSGFFACFPPPNGVDVCGSCDNENGPFCSPELTCVQNGAGACYRYCCSNADCGEGAICDATFAAEALGPSNPADQVGLCVSSVASEAPACNAPSSTPSGGSCVGGYPPVTRVTVPDAGVSGTDAGVDTSLPVRADGPVEPTDAGRDGSPFRPDGGWDHDGGSSHDGGFGPR